MTDLVTVTPAQLPKLSAISPNALTVVQEPDGPVAAVEVKTLLGRLIQTDTIKTTEALLQAAAADFADAKVGLVIDDPAPAKNGWYRKAGAAGSGSFVQFEKLSGQGLAEVQAAITAATAALDAKVASATASATAAATAAALLSPYQTAPASSDSAAGLVWARFYEKDVDGVAVAVPSNVVVREIQRYNTNFIRLRFGAAGGAQFAREEGNGTFFDATGLSGFRLINLIDDSGNVGANARVIGQAMVNLSLLNNQAYSGVSRELALDRFKLFRNPADIFATGRQILDAAPWLYLLIADSLQGDARFKSALRVGAWSTEMTNIFLRRLITDIHLYHADRSAQYHLKKISFYGGVGNLSPYVRIFIGNFTTGATLLELSFDMPTPATSTGTARAEFAAWLAAAWRTYVATDENYGDNNRLAWLSFDWSVLPELAYGDYNYTTMALGGINPDRVHDDGTAGASYLDSDHYHELIDVAAGGTAITTAITGLQWVLPGISTRAHFHNRVRLRLAEGAHLSTNAELPAYVELAGMGQPRTFVYRNGSTPREVLAGYRDTKVRDLTIVSDLSPQYPWHTDAANGRTFDNTGAQNRRFYQSFKNVDFVMTGDNVGQGFGCGISSGQVIDFEACRAWHTTTALPGSNYTSAPFFFHDTGKTSGFPTQNNSILPARVNMRSCASSDDYVESVYLQTLERVALCTLTLTDCDFAMIKHEVVQGEVATDLARDRVGWIVTGVHRGAFQYKDLDGAIVLAAPTGTTVGGALAAVMFGAVDELGRGEKWIKGGTTKSLGARLGNRTGNSESLTLNGTSWTPNTNLSASSNATIIASVLAATGVQLTEVDLRLEHYPAAAPVRRMNNNSGVLIPKGRFVKRTALGKIALAQPGDRIFGWTIRAIRNGDDGDVMIGRRIWWEYLDGVTAAQINGGDFWLAANGTISFAAADRNILPGVLPDDISATADAIRYAFSFAITEADRASKVGRLIGGTAEIWG